MWFIDQLEGSVQYHIPAVLRLKGALNKEALQKALGEIVNRHEVLRTVYLSEDGQARQHIQDRDQWELKEEKERPANKEELQQYIQQVHQEHPLT